MTVFEVEHPFKESAGFFAQQIAAVFALACRRAGIIGRGPHLSTAAFRRPSESQLSLFE
jgi:hypothetical protein